ncbi:MAG: Na(+) H(+) antiporter subunit G [Nitrospira sp.]|jgi:multicomponent K+:H+ antiporter subunit G|nr:MAG: Na(+) H(+) antiporter subunit G [Nitrospira sp.]
MLDILVSVLLLVGSLFVVVGAFSLVRLPDFFMRLHGPTKSTTLGVGSFLLAAVVHSADGGFTLRELLIALFLFMTAPVSAFLLGQVGLRRRVTSRAPIPEDFPGLRR